MIRILNNGEIGCISGGWTCAKTYEGKLFRKAVWHAATTNSDNQNFGTCYYRLDGEMLFYSAPKNLSGIVQKPINHWLFVKDMVGGYSVYECCKTNASNCVFEEA